MNWNLTKNQAGPAFEADNSVAFAIVARRGMMFPTVAVYHKAPKDPARPWFDPVTKEWLTPQDVTHWAQEPMPYQEPLDDAEIAEEVEAEVETATPKRPTLTAVK